MTTELNNESVSLQRLTQADAVLRLAEQNNRSGALHKELGRALAAEEHARSMFAKPYASTETLADLWEARGYARGIAKAIELLQIDGSGEQNDH